ncbi:coiled-coil domain-containing protein 63 isoform X3 [Zootermopsis nevadensis]|uniref:coiled-coil domain-containing protein 63 isoform X3 n=1 Tax=Zootermopsis nevadensis TaxID=136037 RepID=UPI000B8E6994|nr:coiled-coil domain-containing protein 63 isoform X3 [Zootermopsis nevadensis]
MCQRQNDRLSCARLCWMRMALRKATAEDLDMNHLAKAELSRLQRQYRIMEGDRQSYSQETNIVLRKQRRMIKTLEAERKELLTNLHVAKSPLNDVKDNKVTSELARLLNLTDRYDAAVKSEKLQLSELNLQIKKVEKEVLELKKLDISDNVLLQKSRNTERNVSSLENRLGVQLVSRLNSGKKVMVDLIEQATLAYDQREESQNKLQALKERAKQDLQQQSQEIRELQRRLDRDVKLQEFLGVKGQRRIMADLEAREALRFKKKREAAEHMITTFEKILSQIKEFSGETDIDRLAAQFVKQEEENFAIFNYVNELNNEVEALQDQVWNLHQKIEDQRDLRNRRVLQQQETLARLASTLTEKTSSADCVQRKLQECSAILEKLLQGIEHIFHLMRCDRAPVLFLLGDNKHVTAYNVMLYLDIIERRIIDLMNVMCCLE